MDVDGIILQRKNNVVDDLGSVISSGDVCLNTDYYKFIRIDEDRTIIDMTPLKTVTAAPYVTPLIYSVMLFENEKGSKKIDIPIDSRFKTFQRAWMNPYTPLQIIELFELDDGFVCPLVHSYNTQFNAWLLYGCGRHANEPEYSVVKIQERDISKIFLKLIDDSGGLSRSVMETLALSPAKILKEDGTLSLSYRDMKCSRFLQKTQRAIRSRTSWVKNTSKLPRLTLEFNNSGKNALTADLFSAHGGYILNEFYNEPEQSRDMEIYCTKPGSSHKETIYRYSRAKTSK